PVKAIMINMSNLLAYIYDVCADITSSFDHTATNIANAMIDAINCIIKAWNSAVGIFGLNGLKGTEINHITSVTTSFRNLAQQNRNIAEKYKPADYWSTTKFNGISLDSAMISGYNWGSNLGKKVLDTAKNLGNNLASSGLGDLINDIANNTADTASNTNLTNEDLEYLRNLAERDTINRFTTSQIKVEMINNNSIASDLDIDGVVNVLTDKLNEQLAMQVEGVYY
ncbi:MAG: hypothetical protein K2L37_04275, partial [Lactobacillus sp.]|nr:hypothetical protein [Lactobacillus sp.]